MFNLYKYYIQNQIQNSILPISIEFIEINMAMSFNPPYFEEKAEKVLLFNIYYHSYYDKETYKYKDDLQKDIRFKINTLWKHTILHFNKFEIYIIRISIYCIVFGLLLLFVSYLSYLQIDDIQLQKTYIFFTFMAFSYWLYITIIILRAETIIESFVENKIKYEIYTIKNNLNINSKQIKKLSQKVEKINKYIQAYITAVSTVFYIGFLTILGTIF